MAKGADELGRAWALSLGIPLKKFYADWDKYGKRAGPIRNKQMAEYADAAIILWDGKSKGSMNLKKIMDSLGKPVFNCVCVGFNK